jgi:PST family polysaccharide transporter
LKPFDENGVFRPDVNDGSLLRHLAVRGAGATVFAGGMGQAIQIISIVVLARLLSPTDFGLVTMVTTFSLLFMNFGLNGFTEAILQRKEVDQNLISNLFWINLSIGTLLTVCFASLGPLFARFYHSPHLAPISVGVATTIFITSLSVIHLALLKRAMCFTVTSLNDIVSRFVSVAVMIVLALAHWGYWALVAGTIAQALSTTLGAFVLCPWIPLFPRRANGTAVATKFAMNVYGRFSVNYCARNLDNVLVGWRFNAQALGFYKKAYDLFAFSAPLFVQSVTNVAVSALSRLQQDAEQFKRYLLKTLMLAAFIGMGLGTDLTLVGKDVIRLLLGPAWAPTGQIFTFFGPGIGVMFIYGIHSWIHLSIGRADRWLRWTVFEFLVTASLFVLGLRFGPNGIAIAWTVSFWILLLPAFWYAGRPIHFGVGAVVATVWRYIVAAIVGAGATLVAFSRFQSLVAASSWIAALQGFVSISIVFWILYLAAVAALHQSFAPILQVVRLLQEMRPKRRLPSSEPLAVAAGQGTGR